MLNLDTVEKIKDYSIIKGNKTYTFDTVLLVSKIGQELVGVTDPIEIQKKVSQIMGLDLSVQESLTVLRDFEKFSESFTESLKNLFGRSQSSSDTTESDPKNMSA